MGQLTPGNLESGLFSLFKKKSRNSFSLDYPNSSSHAYQGTSWQKKGLRRITAKRVHDKAVRPPPNTSPPTRAPLPPIAAQRMRGIRYSPAPTSLGTHAALQVLGLELLQSRDTHERSPVLCGRDRQCPADDGTQTRQETNKAQGPHFAVDDLHRGDILGESIR